MSKIARSSPSPNKSINKLHKALAGSDEINLEKITPELAAKIVKHFVLPMFDNAPRSKVGKRLGHNHKNDGSIYNELKLSEQLNETLNEVRNEVQNLTNSLEIEQEKRMRLE